MKKDQTKSKPIINAISPLRISLFVLVVTFLVISGVSGLVYWQELTNGWSSVQKNEQDRIHAMLEHVRGTIYTLGADLRIASTHADLEEYFVTGADTALNQLSSEYLVMSQTKRIYDQIRFIDSSGLEIIRVNYNDGDVYVVEPDDLQDKKSRYYFDEAFQLEIKDFYISPFDLNVEYDEIESPLKPMIRIGKPVFDSNGHRQGIVVLNYLGDELLESMDTFYQSSGGTLLFVNQDGYWIKGFQEADEWGFMFEDRSDKNIKVSHESVWSAINADELGQLVTDEGLYTYGRVYPAADILGDQYLDTSPGLELSEYEQAWVIISFVPREQIISPAVDMIKTVIFIDIVLYFIICVLVWYLIKILKKRQRDEKTIIELNDLMRIINKMLRHDVLGKLTAARLNLEASDLVEKNEPVTDAHQVVKEGIQVVKNMKELETSFALDKPSKQYDLVELVKQVGQEQSVKIQLKGEAQVLADEAIYSVFENLIRNAKLHGGVKTVSVVFEKKGKRLIIRISDQGSGIDPEIRDSLFEEGVKSSTTGNTGIGLFVTKKTVERYGGTIRVEDNQPKGTVFVIELPV